MQNGPYARISVLRPHDGDTIDFEAGYIRHLEWHRQAKDPWKWFGWTVWVGERQRSFVYATFGRSAAELDSAVNPVDDERDNIANVTPHGHFAGSALYEFLPALSRGSGEPQPVLRVELTTVDVDAGAEKRFSAALAAVQPSLQTETLWYRLVAGGPTPRYLRLRPRPTISAILAMGRDLPDMIERATIEVLNLRPAMCYGIEKNA
jgi:hypothetical protein